MRTCHSCDYFRKANEEGGQCHLEPPAIFLIPVQSAAKMGPDGKTLVPGDVRMLPGTFWKAVRCTDGCSHHQPKTSDEVRPVPRAN